MLHAQGRLLLLPHYQAAGFRGLARELCLSITKTKTGG